LIKTTIDPKLDQLPETGARPIELFLKGLKEKGFEMPPMDICSRDHGDNLPNHEAIWMLRRSGVKIAITNWEIKSMPLLMNLDDIHEDSPLRSLHLVPRISKPLPKCSEKYNEAEKKPEEMARG